MRRKEFVKLTVPECCLAKVLDIVKDRCWCFHIVPRNNANCSSSIKMEVNYYSLDHFLEELRSENIAYTIRIKVKGKTVDIRQLRFDSSGKISETGLPIKTDLPWIGQGQWYCECKLVELLLK